MWIKINRKKFLYILKKITLQYIILGSKNTCEYGLSVMKFKNYYKVYILTKEEQKWLQEKRIYGY